MDINSLPSTRAPRLQQAALTGLAAFVLHDRSQLIKDHIPRGKQDIGVFQPVWNQKQ